MPGGPRLWLRWSLRDLRSRWVVVAATALVIALGTGTYAGLSSQAQWRKDSLDLSYQRAAAHDVRLSLPEGSFVPAGKLARRLEAIPHADAVSAREERLVARTQVDASQRGEAILVPGRVIGLDVAGGSPRIDRLTTHAGRSLRPSDEGAAVAQLEQHFATFYDLPASGSVRVGGRRVRYVGHAVTPDWFLVVSDAGWGAESNLAAVFMPLGSAQDLVGQPGRVNELVVRVRDTRDAAIVAAEARRAIGGGATATLLKDEDVHRTLYRDADNDALLFDIYAYLLLGAATFSAFVLVSRMMEAQRREVGVGMALGVPPVALAIRPMLVAAEIAFLGVAFGLPVGVAFSELFSGLVEEMLPLPHWADLFRIETFAVAAALGFVLPFAATAWPVLRGVAMKPIDAILVGARARSGGGLAPLLRRVPLPGRSMAQMPLRNVLRAPRRTLLTVFGIAAVLAALVSLAGMVDSMRSTVDRAQAATLHESPERLDVALAGFARWDSRTVAAVATSPAVGRAEPRLVVPGALLANGRRIDVALSLVDQRSRIWTPQLESGSLKLPGVALSERAAEELGLERGDDLQIEHLARGAAGSLERTRTTVPLTALHASPFRFEAYVDARAAELTGFGGVANFVTVTPAPGRTQADVERALFGLPGVASVEPAAALTQTTQTAIDDFLAAIIITEVFVLVLAVLIAFNAASINAEERRRESATMFAFGVPLRRVLSIAVAENFLVGLLATAVGIAAGLGLVSWMVGELLPETFPELGATVSLSTGSLLIAVAVGTLAVALAPLFTVHRLRRMDLPGTLRVME